MTEAEYKERFEKWRNLPENEKQSEVGRHEHDLLDWAGMINSCFTYGQCKHLEDYITGKNKDFYGHLTEQEKRDIMDEHLKYLRNHAKIKRNVYTDGEGCSYNALLW